MALGDLIDFERGAYVLDTAAIRHLVDAATTADPHYTPSTTRREARTLDSQARYARWQKAYRALKQRRPHMSDVWYAQQIAKQTVAAGFRPRQGGGRRPPPCPSRMETLPRWRRP